MSELMFVIEEGVPSLIIKVETKELSVKRILYRDSLRAAAKDKDREAIEFLIKEELRHLGISSLSGQAETAPFNRIRISSNSMTDAFKLLGATGKLYLKKQKLFVDPFIPVQLCLEASHKEGKLLVEGKILMGSKESDVATIQGFFTGSSVWIVKEGTLCKFSQKIDKKWMDLVYPKSSLLEGKQKDTFIELFEDEDGPDNAPKVKWINKDNKQEQRIEPLPFLVLKDRTGAFADLWMDYGDLGKISFHETKKNSFRESTKEKFWEKDLLETGFMPKVREDSQYYCPLDKVAKSLTFLLEIGWNLFDHRGRRIVRQGEIALSLEEETDRIFVQGKVSYGEHEANVKDVVGAFTRREQFVSLNNQVVGLIDHEKIQEDYGDLSALEVTAKGLAVKRAEWGILEPLLVDKRVQKDESLKSLTVELSPPSERFKGALHSYQQDGVNWLSFLKKGGFSGLLADEMGLGKTVQTIGFFSTLEKKTPIIVIVPTSLVFNWQREIEKFLPDLKVYLHSGKDRNRTSEELSSHELILTSYALLRLDAALLQSVPYECIVLDEAQYIKNPESQVARAAFLLKGKFRLAITGTPIENRWGDLWSLFYFLLPDLLGEQKEFDAKMLSAQADTRYLTQLRKKLRPFLLRRRKDEVADQLPEKIEQVIWTEMQEGQRAIYEEWMSKNRMGLLKKVEREGINSCRMEILEAILRLRQICCHPFLVDPSHSLEPSEMSGKLERLLSDVEEAIAEKRKVLIYSQFTQMLRVIEKEIQNRGWGYAYLDGSTKDRESAVRKFQEEKDVPLFLVSLKAGGVGLNLTAADYVFLFDPWWNEAVESQAIDRAHRFGRKGTVIARRYVTPLSIEEKIMKLKDHKSSLSRALLDFEQQIETLSIEDIYELLL